MDPIQLRLEVFRELLQYHQLGSEGEPTVNKLIEQTLDISSAIEESVKVNTTPGGERS
jgi:hypothetical protein